MSTPITERWGTRLVAVCGGALALAGLGYASFPHALAALTGIELGTPTATTDLRATYGGLQLALGTWLLGCWWRGALRPGLALLGVATTWVAGVRAFGIYVDGAAAFPNGVAAALEALVGAAALAALLVIHRGTDGRVESTRSHEGALPGSVPQPRGASAGAVRGASGSK